MYSISMIIAIWWIFLTCAVFNLSSALVPIYIGGFFPQQNEQWDGSSILPAVQLAIEEVNRNSSALPGYDLKMVWNDTKCDAGVGMQGLFRQLHSPPVKHIILGAGCTIVTGPLAELSHRWNLVQISHSSSSPNLNNRDIYPRLFRAYPSEDSINPPRLALMKSFGWKKVAMLYATDGSFSKVIESMRKLMVDNGYEIVVSESFSDNPQAALENIKQKEARVIIANFFANSARQTFCKAFGLGLTGPTFTWMIPGWYNRHWWQVDDTECTRDQMNAAVEGYIGMEAVSISDGSHTTDVNLSPDQFLSDYRMKIAGHNYTSQNFAPYGYDSVWVIAHALRAADDILQKQGLTLQNFSYENPLVGDVILEAVNHSLFTGITGPLQFSRNGKRIGYTKIEQLQDGEEVELAVYHSNDGMITYDPNITFRWKTENGKPPTDGPVIVTEWLSVAAPLFYSMCVLSIIGMMFSIAIFSVNIIYRSRRLVRMSSPKINYLICIGSFMMYACIILYAIDSSYLYQTPIPSPAFSLICVFKKWILAVSFTLAFGATFAKVWRIHRIFTNAKMERRSIKDHHLIGIVAFLLLLDAIHMTAWDIIDMPKGEVLHLPKEKSGEDRFVNPKVEICRSNQTNLWLGIGYGYKALLLLYGAFLAWDTRKVKIDALNDAKNIAITIYTGAIMCAIAVPVSMLFPEKVDFAYAVTSMTIVVSNTVLLILGFVPKIHILLTNSIQDENNVINNMTRAPTNKSGDGVIVNLRRKIIQLEEINAKLEIQVRNEQQNNNTDIEKTKVDAIILTRNGIHASKNTDSGDNRQSETSVFTIEKDNI